VADLPSSCWRAAASPAFEAAHARALKLLERREVRTTKLRKGQPERDFVSYGSANRYLEGRSGGGVSWASIMEKVPLKRDTPLTAALVRSRLELKVKKLSARGGFLRPSAPIGRLLRKENDRLIWIKDPKVPKWARGQ